MLSAPLCDRFSTALAPRTNSYLDSCPHPNYCLRFQPVSKAQHDVATVDRQGRVIVRARAADDAVGLSQLLERLADHGDGESIEIGIDKGLVVAPLTAAGFMLFAINPRAAARYRECHGQAGGKSDRGDVVMLANILRIDRHVHRPLPADTELARAVKATARQHPGSDLGWAAGDEPAAVCAG